MVTNRILMITDIFTSFDPQSTKAFIPFTSLLMSLNLILLTLTTNSLWPTETRKSSPIITPLELILIQLWRTSTQQLKGLSLIISTIFLIIITINLIGIIPYTFSLSSHLIITLRFGLPLWISIILSRLSKYPKKSLAHLLPDGAPIWLNPFLVLIETTRIIIRPLTLSFRLAANITAGHIVLTLIRTYSTNSLIIISLISPFILLTVIGYIIFELAICLIQAYIFCLLLSLYSNDHAH